MCTKSAHGVSLWIGVWSVLSAATAFAGPPGEFTTRLEIVGPTEPLRTGAEFRATVQMDSETDGVQGWSLGVAHDPAVLELLRTEIGSTTATVMNGAPPQFLVVDDMPRGENVGVTMAVVISFTQPISLSAANDYEILLIDYRVIGDPLAGAPDPCVDIETAVAFSDDINQPPVASVLTVNGGTNVPELVDLPITIECPAEYEIAISRCEGDTENVYLEWTMSFESEFLFLYRDGELLSELDPATRSFTDEALEPGDYLYTVATLVVDLERDPSVFAVFDHCTATVIPVTVETIEPQLAYFLGGEEVTITGTAFTTAELTTLSFFAEGEEPLLLENIVIVSDTELTATVPASPRLGRYSLRLENERGSAELLDTFEYGFIRGEVNADGAVDISDGIAIVGYLFLGEELGPCLDAADATDDAQIDVSDAIRIFGFLFSGFQPPAAPFPDPGQDTTPDAYGCLDPVEA